MPQRCLKVKQATCIYMDAGRRLWMSKVIVSHLDAKEMENALDALMFKMRMTKSEELAFHFTHRSKVRG